MLNYACHSMRVLGCDTGRDCLRHAADQSKRPTLPHIDLVS
jgi:hypothetical protein